MDATHGLPGSTPEHVGRRLDAQEAEGRAIGKDDLPVFVEEHQGVRNRTQDLIQQRDTRKQLEQVFDLQLRRPLGGCKLGLHDLDVLLRPVVRCFLSFSIQCTARLSTVNSEIYGAGPLDRESFPARLTAAWSMRPKAPCP
jgi:hypothetical protein